MKQNVAPSGAKINTDWKEEARKTGLPVFPVSIHPGKNGKMDKVPLTPNGLNDASKDVERFDWSGANGYGIRMGDGLFAFDLDTWKPGSAGLGWLEAQGVPTGTRKHRTVSGGQHWLYTLPEEWKDLPSGQHIVTGLDTRGAGGFIAFGEGYSLLDETAPAALPVAVCEALHERWVRLNAGSVTGPLEPWQEPEGAEEKLKDLLAEDQSLAKRWSGDPDGLSDTSRSGFDFSLARKLANKGCDYDFIVWALMHEDSPGKREERQAMRAATKALVPEPRKSGREEFGALNVVEFPHSVPERAVSFPVPKPFSQIRFPSKPVMLMGDWLAPVSVNAIYSRAGVGKTGLMVNLMEHLRSGDPFMGQPGMKGGFKGGMLWVNGDLPPALAAKQLAGLGPIGCEYVEMVDPKSKKPIDLSVEKNWDRMLDTAARYGFVVFDTRSSLFKGDHMDAEQTDVLFTRLQTLAREGVCVWVCLHAGKPSANTENQSMFGSSANEWYLDNLFGLRRPTKTEWNCLGNTPQAVKDAMRELQAAGVPHRGAFIFEHEKAKWAANLPGKAMGWVPVGNGQRKLVTALTDL